MSSDAPLRVEQLGDYLRCPTRYRFEHVTALSGERDGTDERRVDLVRVVVCDALQRAMREDVDLGDAATDALDDRWRAYTDEAEHHSAHQHRYDYRTLRTGIADACERHVDSSGVAAARDALDRPVVGPDLVLDIGLDAGTRYRVAVDYLRVADGNLDAVCLTDSLWRIGLPYAGMDVFEKHFGEGQFRPDGVARVFENFLAESWLAAAASDTPYEPGSLHYLGVLEDHSRAGDAVRVESEQRAVATHYGCSDTDVRDRLRTVTTSIDEGVFDPSEFFESEGFGSHSFDDITERECGDCAYRAGCERRIRQEVRFDE